jgi:hypothetical protein
MSIQKKELSGRQARQPPIEGGGIGDDLDRPLLERNKDTWCAQPRSVDQALQSEDCFARAGAAYEQSRAMAR